MTSHRVAVVVPSRVATFELGVALEVFTHPRPDQVRKWYDVRVCTADPGAQTVTGGLFAIHVDRGMEEIDEVDTVIVPSAESVEAPAAPSVLDALRRAHDRGVRLVSFCTGAFVLAAAGLLDGRRATTHWQHARRLAMDHPRVRVDPNVLYVDEGQVLTSAGNAAAIDLSLHVVRKDHGARVARRLSRDLVMAPHREGGQAQFILTPAPVVAPGADDGIERAMEHARDHLAGDLSLATLAGVAHMSPRNFSRRFARVTGTTTAKWVVTQRLAGARALLEETDLPVELIAAQTGFGSPATFRQRFAESLRTSPSAYRRAFRSGFEDVAS